MTFTACPDIGRSNVRWQPGSEVPPCNPGGGSPSLRKALPCITGPFFTVRSPGPTSCATVRVAVDPHARGPWLRVEWTGPLLGSVEDAPTPVCPRRCARGGR